MKRIYLPAAALLALANALILLRVLVGGVNLETMRPLIKYYLTLEMEASLHGGHATLKTFLPVEGEHQNVETETVSSNHLAYSLEKSPPNRRGVWDARGISGQELAIYDAIVAIRAQTYELPIGAAIPKSYPPTVARELRATETIQSDAPEIRQAATDLVAAAGAHDIAGTIRALYDFAHDQVRASQFENTLDALTTLKWKEAFCGGKSRLLAALLRASGIPARMVGGIILEPGSKRTTHAWVEAWVNGVWVPFDALNGHYAEHPANYLVLYYGDQVLFSRTSNLNFQYHFNIRKWRTSPDENLDVATSRILNPYAFWHAFQKAHITLNLLRIILMLPIGVLAIVVFRNVIGMTTFGVFQPALMAIAFRETGFWWGALLYLCLLLVGSVLRRLLDRLQLLHTPRVAILLVFVVTFMLLVTYGAVRVGAFEPAHVSLFPIAVLALTVENFFRTATEQGPSRAVSVLGQTLFVAGTVYALMNAYAVQAVIFVFPETLLGVVAACMVLGRWTGMRWVEYLRFRPLLAAEGSR